MGDLEDFVPDIQTHDPELACALSKDLKVLKRYDPGQLAHPQAQLPRTANLIPLKIVILLHVELLNIVDLRVHLQRMQHNALALRNVHALLGVQILWDCEGGVQLSRRLVRGEVGVELAQEYGWGAHAAADYSALEFLAGFVVVDWF